MDGMMRLKRNQMSVVADVTCEVEEEGRTVGVLNLNWKANAG